MDKYFQFESHFKSRKKLSFIEEKKSPKCLKMSEVENIYWNKKSNKIPEHTINSETKKTVVCVHFHNITCCKNLHVE